MRSLDNLMALANWPTCHGHGHTCTPTGVAGGTCDIDVLGKVRSLDSIGGDVSSDVLEGRG